MPSDPSLKKRIVLVEDHPVTRAGLVALINQSGDLEVCGESDDVAWGLELILNLKPDLVIVDISLKTASGIGLVKKLKEVVPALPALVISMHDESFFAEKALRAGARGYVMKQDASEQILAGARQVLKDELYLSPKMQEKMLRRPLQIKIAKDSVYTIDTLSDREMEVFVLLGKGESTSEIADALSISIKTVETYREHLKLKLGLRDAPELIRHAVQWAKSEHLLS